MDLETRKYYFIKELFNINRESVMDALEYVLKLDKVAGDISLINQQELDNRLKSYMENPEDLLDWDDVKKNW